MRKYLDNILLNKSLERLEEIRKIGIKMSERLRLQEMETSTQKPGLLKFARTSPIRSKTTITQKRGIKTIRFSSDRRAGKLQSFESGFCEDIEENRKEAFRNKVLKN